MQPGVVPLASHILAVVQQFLCAPAFAWAWDLSNASEPVPTAADLRKDCCLSWRKQHASDAQSAYAYNPPAPRSTTGSTEAFPRTVSIT
eukprot:6126-Amphidinium_carterae.1